MPTTEAELNATAASLLDEPNDWTDWMAGFDIERLSWMRLAAMLLRDVPVAAVVNRLAAGLAIRQAIQAATVAEAFEDLENKDRREVDWAFWTEHWNGAGRTPFDDLMVELDEVLFAPYDAELKLSMWRTGDGWVEPRAFLWFLLSAIRGWAGRTLYVCMVKPGARWLLELHRGDRADADPLAALLAHFYDGFRMAGYAPTRPLPDDLAIDKPVMVRGVRPLREAIEV